jgi:hypothetical protein
MRFSFGKRLIDIKKSTKRRKQIKKAQYKEQYSLLCNVISLVAIKIKT